jgi:hypothetical protein
MSCRCSDIGKVNNDLKTLGSMAAKINSISKRNGIQKTTLAKASNYAGSSIKPDNINELTRGIIKAQDKIVDSTLDMSSRISREITSLTHTLSNLRSEDRSYHESKNKDK